MVTARNRNVSIIFHVGLDNSSTKYDFMRSEQETYGDILQNNMLDTYQNLTRMWSSIYRVGFMNGKISVKSCFMIMWAKNLSESHKISHIVKGERKLTFKLTFNVFKLMTMFGSMLDGWRRSSQTAPGLRRSPCTGLSTTISWTWRGQDQGLILTMTRWDGDSLLVLKDWRYSELRL